MRLPHLLNEVESGALVRHTVLGRRTHVPNCDLDRTLELLYAFQELAGADGTRLKNNYHRDGWNWFPSTISHLYWRCFYRYVQYEELAREQLSGWQPDIFLNSMSYRKLYKMLHPRRYPPATDDGTNKAVREHNLRIAREHPGSLLLFNANPNNFRTRAIEQTLQELGVGYVQVFEYSRKTFEKASTFDVPVFFLPRRFHVPNIFGHRYDLSGLDPVYARFVGLLIEQIEEIISHHVWELGWHNELMQQMRPAALLGMDDTNVLHPLLYACKSLHTPTIGYQVGTYGLRQASYSLRGIAPDTFQWFDKLIVWGPFWKEMLTRYSDALRDVDIVIGASKHAPTIQPEPCVPEARKNVLIPYECFANTHAVGRYIERFIDNGYTVYLKARPDAQPEKQLESYFLPDDYRRRVQLVTTVDADLMRHINIVAGSMSTFIFDMLPYGKHTWILETEFKLLEKFSQTETVRSVSLDEIATLAAPPCEVVSHPLRMFDSGEQMSTTLQQHVLPLLES